MHLYYKENVPTLNIVGSGFFDSIGLFRKCNAEQETVALEWMKVFGIEHLKDRLFLTLSSGEQRLALLALSLIHIYIHFGNFLSVEDNHDMLSGAFDTHMIPLPGFFDYLVLHGA